MIFLKKSASVVRPETLATRDKSASLVLLKNENIANKELAEKLDKPIIRKIKKSKVYSSFINDI